MRQRIVIVAAACALAAVWLTLPGPDRPAGYPLQVSDQAGSPRPAGFEPERTESAEPAQATSRTPAAAEQWSRFSGGVIDNFGNPVTDCTISIAPLQAIAGELPTATIQRSGPLDAGGRFSIPIPTDWTDRLAGVVLINEDGSFLEHLLLRPKEDMLVRVAGPADPIRQVEGRIRLSPPTIGGSWYLTPADRRGIYAFGSFHDGVVDLATSNARYRRERFAQERLLLALYDERSAPIALLPFANLAALESALRGQLQLEVRQRTLLPAAIGAEPAAMVEVALAMAPPGTQQIMRRSTSGGPIVVPCVDGTLLAVRAFDRRREASAHALLPIDAGTTFPVQWSTVLPGPHQLTVQVTTNAPLANPRLQITATRTDGVTPPSVLLQVSATKDVRLDGDDPTATVAFEHLPPGNYLLQARLAQGSRGLLAATNAMVPGPHTRLELAQPITLCILAPCDPGQVLAGALEVFLRPMSGGQTRFERLVPDGLAGLRGCVVSDLVPGAIEYEIRHGDCFANGIVETSPTTHLEVIQPDFRPGIVIAGEIEGAERGDIVCVDGLPDGPPWLSTPVANGRFRLVLPPHMANPRLAIGNCHDQARTPILMVAEGQFVRAR